MCSARVTFPRASPHPQTGPIWSLCEGCSPQSALKQCHNSSSPAGCCQPTDVLLRSNNRRDSVMASNGLRDADPACITTFPLPLLPRPLGTVLARGSVLPVLPDEVLVLLPVSELSRVLPCGVNAPGPLMLLSKAPSILSSPWSSSLSSYLSSHLVLVS